MSTIKIKLPEAEIVNLVAKKKVELEAKLKVDLDSFEATLKAREFEVTLDESVSDVVETKSKRTKWGEAEVAELKRLYDEGSRGRAIATALGKKIEVVNAKIASIYGKNK